MTTSKKVDHSFGGELSEITPNWVEHQPLHDLNNLQLGGVADFYTETDNLETLTKLVRLASGQNIPYSVIGAGTGIIISDYGLPGLVIKNKSHGWNLIGNNQVLVQSGTSSKELASAMSSRGLGGIEYLVAIPGTVGGALITKAVSGNHSIENYVKETIWFNCRGLECKIVTLNQGDTFKLIDTIKNQYLTEYWTLLSIKLQLSQLQPEEALRRLRECHNLAKKYPNEKCLGYFMDKIVPADLHKDKNFHEFFRGNIYLHKKDPNFLVIAKQATSNEVKDLCDNLVLALGQYLGLEYKLRTDLIGLWPKDEGK